MVLLAALAFAVPTRAVEPTDVALNPVAAFDVSLVGWAATSAQGGTIAWVPEDASGNPASGAARFSGPAGRYRLEACFELTVPGLPLHYFAIANTRTSGDTARVRAYFIAGFAGDLGETGNCPGPHTHAALVSDVQLQPSPQFTALVSPVRRADAGPALTLVVVVDKADAADVVVDDLQIFATDHLFIDGLEVTPSDQTFPPG